MFSTKKYRFLRPARAARFLVGVVVLLALAAPALAQQGPFVPGDYCTYTQGGWGSAPRGNNPGMILKNNFSTVYPGGFVEVGIPGTGGFSMTFTMATAIEGYLPAGSKANALTGDLTNPTSSSSGVFGGQVLALQLNVDFAAAGIIGNSSLPAFGDLVITGTGTSFDMLTVRAVLDAANQALGGGALPPDYSIRGTVSGTHNLNELVSFLNQGFDNCLPSGWAQQYLAPVSGGEDPPPPPA